MIDYPSHIQVGTVVHNHDTGDAKTTHDLDRFAGRLTDIHIGSGIVIRKA